MPREFIQKLTCLVEASLANEKFGPEDLAKEAGMSQSNLNRKLKAINKQTISQFIREIRLKKAKELLQNEELTAAEISYRVGFGSPTYFSKCFHEYYGIAPGELRNQESEIEPEVLPAELQPKKSKQKTILIRLVVSLIILIPLFFFLVIKNPVFKTIDAKDKTIAVLPFKNLSLDNINQYRAEGMKDAITNNISTIKDLIVIRGPSVEQYRESDKPANIIGRELNVSYFLEGSFLQEGNQIILNVWLINTKNGQQVWSNSYDLLWEDIFSVRSKVVESVAGALHAAITPEEIQLIQKVPTINLTAYDYYERGKYKLENEPDSNAFKEAKKLFNQALDSDSTFALAYVGLASVFGNQNFSKTYFSDNYLDSVLILSNKAISFDDKCSEAYQERGMRYFYLGKPELALKELNKAIEHNPNNHLAYLFCGHIYLVNQVDYVEALRNYFACAARNRGKKLSETLSIIGYAFYLAGFNEQAKHYYQEKLKLDGDSASYINTVNVLGESPEMIYQHRKTAYEKDTTRLNLDLLHSCFATGRYEEAYYHAKRIVEWLKINDAIPVIFAHRIGYAFWKVGKTEEAGYYFNLQKKIGLESIEKGRLIAIRMSAYYDLAAVYAFEGDKKNAYKYLEELYKREVFAVYWIQLLNNDPLFDKIRNESRFQKIVRHVEEGHQAEHERVGKWLEEQGMLEPESL